MERNPLALIDTIDSSQKVSIFALSSTVLSDDEFKREMNVCQLRLLKEIFGTIKSKDT